jgi:hypothetical protein
MGFKFEKLDVWQLALEYVDLFYFRNRVKFGSQTDEGSLVVFCRP